jgi:putative membrane protein
MQRVQLIARAAALAVVCTVTSAGLHAQTKPSGAQSSAPANQQLSSDDIAFVTQAAQDGMKEVEHARMVASKASNAQVKAYANRLVKDHTNANNQLKAIAKRKNIDLPEVPSSTEHRGSVGAKNDATTETKMGSARPNQTNPTGTTGASNSVQTTGVARDQMAGAEPWMSLSGAEFDKGFVEAAVNDHQKAIALFENEASRGTDAQLKAFASKQLPTLRAHLKQAQDLQEKLSTSTR